MVESRLQLDQVFSALADPTRRAILARLRRGSRTVNELAEPFGISLAGVSKHLKVLERARLIHRQRSGRQFIISLAPRPLADADRWLDAYRRFWNSSLDRLDRYVDRQANRQQKKPAAKGHRP